MTRCILVCCFAAGLAVIADSQALTPSATPASLDGGWLSVGQLEQTDNATTLSAAVLVDNSVSKVGASISPVATAYLARADVAKTFRENNLGDARVGDARRIEALMLVYAGYYGDTTTKDRCAQLVAQVRADNTVPAADRYAVASLADYQPLRFGLFDSEEARMAQFEKIARAHVQEFPTVPQVYESFLRLASDSPDEQAIRMLTDLKKMAAPQAFQDEAQVLLDRYSLVGQSLPTLLSPGLVANKMPSITGNQVTVLYSWTTANEATIVMGQIISTAVPSGTMVVGINLDTDVTSARKVAEARNLPGVNLYDAAGSDSVVVRNLRLNGDVVVFVADRTGTIVSVSAQKNVAATILLAGK